MRVFCEAALALCWACVLVFPPPAVPVDAVPPVVLAEAGEAVLWSVLDAFECAVALLSPAVVFWVCVAVLWRCGDELAVVFELCDVALPCAAVAEVCCGPVLVDCVDPGAV